MAGWSISATPMRRLVRHSIRLLLLLLLLIITNRNCEARLRQSDKTSEVTAHRFRVAPNSTDVLIGTDVTLFCSFYEVREPASVVWSKNDIIITDDTDGLRVEEYYATRYKLIGDRSKHEYNLHISNVELDDGGKYTCQRPPTSVGYGPLIATATLTVLVPSEAPKMLGFSNGSIVTIDPTRNESVSFACECLNGKPKADVRWYLNAATLYDGSEYDPRISSQVFLISNTSNPDAAKLQSVRSDIELPTEQLKQADFLWCTCSNAAMPRALSTYIQFNVLSPPSSPVIESSHSDGAVIAETQVTLRCSAQAGNPAGNMIWQRTVPGRNAPTAIKYTYSVENGSLVNQVTFTAYPNDTGTLFQCVVQNEVTKMPLVASHQLNVHFGPTWINVTGKQYAKFGEQIQVSCISSPSNPIAIASWDCPNQKFTQQDVTEGSTRSSYGYGYVSVSNMTVTLPGRNSVAYCSCTMRNPATGTTVVRQVNLTSANAPHQVVIYKSKEDNALLENSTVQLVCVAAGSFPPAKLTWFIGNTKVESETQRVSNDIVMSNVSVSLRREDNRHPFRCDANNLATDNPISASVTLTVYYPPQGVHVSVDPHVIREGTEVTLTCEAGSSNPTSDISWFRGNEQVYSTSTVDIADTYGGWQKRSVLQFTAKEQDDASNWKCLVSHDASDSEISSDVLLSVRHRPTFGPVNRTYSLIENQEWNLAIPVRANPPARSLTWYYNNTQLQADSSMQFDGPLLTIGRVRRAMSGLYKLVATNTEGTSSIEFYVDVLYQISITHIANRTVDIGQSVSFECRYDGNPVNANSVTWISGSSRTTDWKNRADMKRDSINRVVHLLISNVSWEDAGTYVCVGDNRVTSQPAATREALLIVRSPPRIEVRARSMKAAARIGETVELSCLVRSYPCGDITWQKKVEYSHAPVGNSSELSIWTHEVSSIESSYRCMLQSRLRISPVRNSSFGTYRCGARNQLSPQPHLRAVSDIQLVEPGRPDAPTAFELVNATSTSITLRWRAGFPGGYSQKFELRYYDLRTGVHLRPIVLSDNIQLEFLHATIDGLKPNTEYHVTLSSSNKLGESDLQVTLVARTVDSSSLTSDKVAIEASKPFLFGMPVVIFVMIGVIVLFLLLLNIVLIIVCLRRKRTQQKVATYASTPSRISTGNLINSQHNVQFSPLVMERPICDEQYGFNPPFGIVSAGGTVVPFMNGSTLTYHRNSDPSDLQNIALNDFGIKEGNDGTLSNNRYTGNTSVDLPHPEMMEVLDNATAGISYQLARSGPLDMTAINESCGELDGSSLMRPDDVAELHNTGRSRLNGNGTGYRNGMKRESPKHCVTFDANGLGHATPSTIKRNGLISSNANYVPVVYKPQYQRGIGNGSDRQQASITGTLDWANREADI